MYHLDTCEDQLKDFQRVVTGAMNRCLPMRLVKRYPTDKPWITPEIKEAIKVRQQAWAKGNNHSYKIHRNSVIKLSKSGRRRFYNDKVSQMRDTNPKKWWDNIKLLSGLSKPATLTNITVNETIVRDTDLANAINESFCNVASDITPSEFTPIPVTQIPEEYSVSPDEIERSLSTIQERKSIGPDDIPNWLLKNFATVLCRPVCSIFNSSIRQREVPQLWKSADVLPVQKIPHPKSVDSDLRPISLTPVLSKVLEGFVFKWLAPIVLPKIDSHQFGGGQELLCNDCSNRSYSPMAGGYSNTPDFSPIRLDLKRSTGSTITSYCANSRHSYSTELVCQLSSESSSASEARNLKILMEANQCRCGTRYKTGLPVLPSRGQRLPLYKFIDDMNMFEVVSVPVIQTTTLQQEVDSFCQWATTNNMKLNVKKTKEFMVSFLKHTPK